MTRRGEMATRGPHKPQNRVRFPAPPSDRGPDILLFIVLALGAILVIGALAGCAPQTDWTMFDVWLTGEEAVDTPDTRAMIAALEAHVDSVRAARGIAP